MGIDIELLKSYLKVSPSLGLNDIDKHSSFFVKSSDPLIF
jgi:hypothetical protein